MFVVKDLRKIPDIVRDDNDTREQLRLGRRAAEFQGDLSILCTPSNVAAFSKLQKLSLYDNNLHSIERIGLLAETPLAILDLGQNQLESLPDEMGTLVHLKELWVTNNKLTTISEAVLRLPQLTMLHLSNNSISSVPSSIGLATSLQVLSLDNNQLTDLPAEIGQCKDLIELNLRGNRMEILPATIGDCSSLVTLTVSSNRLQVLPETLGKCRQLTYLHANGNPIAHFPASLVSFPHIRINFANTQITSLDPIVLESWTVLTHLHVTAKESSLQDDNGKSVVILSGSPFATKKAKVK
ncbi:hypothetical protein LEN26_001603 [Aphanomyces euteiches]|nr:hypothetical protein LEN26_001603 [Aphanomyces euteiches]KAH9183798.1 hypothetical protein AeNC1_014223 [Aphanomyces euteiches]